MVQARTALRLTIRIGCLIVLLLAGLALYFAAAPFGRRSTRIAKLVWFKGGLLVLNVDVVEVGRPFRACPTLLVANHVSWLDILVLGDAVDATFVAKSEVAGWPVLGWLARLTGTMFVKRHWRFARQQCVELAKRLRTGHDIVLFPEGTSTDGLAVDKFKSTLFAAAGSKILDRPVAVQPVTLAYTALADGAPIAPAHTNRYAWYGDASFAPHFLRALCDDGCRIDLVFHQPVLSWEVQDRKVLARHAAATIASELSLRHARAVAAHAGRALPTTDASAGLPDHLITTPAIPLDGYRDGFGNWRTRLVAAAGPCRLRADTVVRDAGLPDPVATDAIQHAVQDLPADTVMFLLGSRYCDTDYLFEDAWRLFRSSPAGWPRVQAICDFVHDHITFNYGLARPTRIAFDAYREKIGVCPTSLIWPWHFAAA